MPLPSPQPNESQSDFLERGHKLLASEFTDTDQRNAVLFSQWRRSKGESEEEKKAHERFSDDEFQHIQDIPVFKEHSYFRTLRDKNGPVLDADGNPRQVIEHYDLKALKAIVDNCNRRVIETKSFAPITALHTGKRKPDGTLEQPEVVGFAGPYRLGMYGNEEREDGAPFKGKWAIYADEFWFKDKAHRAREMPRRSPEVYVGRPIQDRFLDPITALGAETPALDMGIHYHLNKQGDLVEQYSSPNITVRYSEEESNPEEPPRWHSLGSKHGQMLEHYQNKLNGKPYIPLHGHEVKELQDAGHITTHKKPKLTSSGYDEIRKMHKQVSDHWDAVDKAELDDIQKEKHSQYAAADEPATHTAGFGAWSSASKQDRERYRLLHPITRDIVDDHLRGSGGLKKNAVASSKKTLSKFTPDNANMHWHIRAHEFLDGLEKEKYQAAAMPAASAVAVPTDHNKAKYDGPDCKYSEEEEGELKTSVKDYHVAEAARHRGIAEGHLRDKRLAMADKHRRFAMWHEREAQPYVKDMGSGNLEVPIHSSPSSHELRENFSQEVSGLLAQYVADPETVNACVNVLMNTQIIKRMESFLDSQSAPVNPKEQLQEEEAAAMLGENSGLAQNPNADPNAPPSLEPPAGEEADEVETGVSEEDDGEPPDAKGNEMAEATATPPASGATPPAAPPKKKPEEETAKYELQEFMRNQRIVVDDLTAKYEQQQVAIAGLLDANTKLTNERNQAVRTQKILELRRVHGYVFNEQEAVAKYSQSSEEVFQTWADTVISTAERAPISGPRLSFPSLEIPQGAKDEVGQYGGASQSEAAMIVQYCLEKNQEGEYPTYEEARTKVLKKIEKKERKAAKTA